jgi:DNA polymerase III subunit alpha
MFLIFDTETTGLPRDKKAPLTDFDNWPRAVQIAWQLHDEKGMLVDSASHLIKPEGFTIPFNASKVHGIDTAFAEKNGLPLLEVLEKFNTVLENTKVLVGHNIDFDYSILGAEFLRMQMETPLMKMPQIDTCSEKTAGYCQLPGGRGGKFKLPTLEELYVRLFSERFSNAHNASADVEATARIFLELIRKEQLTSSELQLDDVIVQQFIKANPGPIKDVGIHIQPNYETDTKSAQTKATEFSVVTGKDQHLSQPLVSFSHLRNHSTFSILNSTTSVVDLVKYADRNKMPAVGLTDTGNMMGAFRFVNAISSHNKNEKAAVEAGDKASANLIKGLVGTELYICRNHTDKTVKDNGSIVPFFAKNKKGFANLSMLSSLSFTQGFYYVPRIDKELLLEHKEGLIVTSGGLSGDIPNLLLNIGEHQAEEAILWWKEHFGDDFYFEINRHNLEEEKHLNAFLLEMASKYNIKYFASNNNYYLQQEDADAQDFLICIKDNTRKADPIGRGYGYRYGFPNNEFYFKSQEQMLSLFSDLPEAIETIQEIVDKIEPYDLAREISLPEFEIPNEFVDSEDKKDHGQRGENAYLKHLAYEGAKKRFGKITDEIISRLDFELETIKRTGYPGYFLIVQDLIAEARKMGVAVGPGRGSAAGSLVAYCTGITNVDPLQYGLLFERFLNPDRISMPDIDIDFDDEGRSKVIDYVTKKYGQNKVAQIITYGTLGTKSAIRDIGRALDADLGLVNKLASSTLNVTLSDFYNLPFEKLKEKYRPDQVEAGEMLKQKAEEQSVEGEILRNTIKLEGSVRNTGIHACGFVITPTDLRELVPVILPKESKDGRESALWATQFDNDVAEAAGLLKVDFLGLKTLSLIKETLAIIKKRHRILIDPDQIPLDDLKTYELFQRGETVGIFQYESPGMRKHLKELKPTTFNDLIAMNALYRPGPMAYIPNYIKRKHKLEPVRFDLEETREILEETFGITVYQEQVMLLSQRLASFSKGEADSLRKAMGKKIKAMLPPLKEKFLSGGIQNNHPEKVLEKIWNDWLAFANYAFNKSHSTCYALVAFQTAYLKANYPAEFMAAVLSNNSNDIKQVTFFMEECRRMGIKTLGPDLNESSHKFTVNEKGEIRFGLGAVKNIGDAAVQNIIEERETNGLFGSVFDFLSRINLRNVNKRTLESLAMAGSFDSFAGVHRAQFFYKEANENSTFLEKAIRYAAQMQEMKNSSQTNLFGEETTTETAELKFPDCQPWSKMQELNMELETIGFYISSHPMDDYKIPIKFFTNATISHINHEIGNLKGNKLNFAGQIVAADHLFTQNGKPYARFKVEDQSDSIELILWSETYLKYRHLIEVNTFVFIVAQVQQSYRNQEQNELKIQEVKLLDEVMEKMTKEIGFTLNIQEIDTEGMNLFIDLIEQSKGGKVQFTVRLYDPETKMSTLLRPMKGALEIGKLLNKLGDLSFLEFKLH